MASSARPRPTTNSGRLYRWSPSGIRMMATATAHHAGGVPTLLLTADRRDEQTLGELFYFFEVSCAISGYLLGINPFDQPGVEQYKKNMFRLLGKPGYGDDPVK